MDINSDHLNLNNPQNLELVEARSPYSPEIYRKKEISEKVEIAEGVTAKLKSNSVEAKALKRIASPIADDEWIVVDEVGQEIDMEAVKEKFKQRAYKSKISGTQTSTSGK